MSDTFLSWAAVADGRVVASHAYAIHSRITPGGQVIATPEDAARYVASYAAEPGQTVHIWFGGGVFANVGDPVSGLRPADVTATRD